MAIWADPVRRALRLFVFIGGGTPSLLAPIQIRAILDACESVFELSPGAEVTIEANPNNLDERTAPHCLNGCESP